MSRFVNAIVIALVGFLVVISAVWYVVEWRGRDGIEARVASRWGESGANGTEILSTVRFHNPHSFGIRLLGVEHRVLVNGEEVDQGRWEGTSEVAPGADLSIDVASLLPPDFAPGWWADHVTGEQRTTFAVEGEALFEVGRRDHVVRFAAREEFETSLLRALGHETGGCDQETPRPCVGFGALDWAEGSEPYGAFRFQLFVHNPLDRALVVTHHAVALEWHAVPVAVANGSGSVRVPAASDAAVTLEVAFNGTRLTEWWPRHVAGCEASLMGLAASLTLQEEIPKNEEPPNGTDNGTANNTGNETGNGTGGGTGNGTGNATGNGTGDGTGNDTASPDGTGDGSERASTDEARGWLKGQLGTVLRLLWGEEPPSEQGEKEGTTTLGEPFELVWNSQAATLRTAFLCDDGGG